MEDGISSALKCGEKEKEMPPDPLPSSSKAR